MRNWAEQQEYEKQVRLDWLGELSDTGLGINQAADRVGIGSATLHKMAARLGVKFKMSRLGAKSREVEYKYHAARGLTMMETANAMGVSYWAVTKAKSTYSIKFTEGREKAPPPPKRGAKSPPMTMADFAKLENAAMRSRM